MRLCDYVSFLLYTHTHTHTHTHARASQILQKKIILQKIF